MTMGKAEQFIQEHIRNGSNVSKGFRSKGVSIPSYCLPWLTPDQARMAVEIARDELVERACVWISEHTFLDEKVLIGDFVKAMKNK